MVEGGAYSPFKVRRGGKKEERLIDLCFLRDRHIDSLSCSRFTLCFLVCLGCGRKRGVEDCGLGKAEILQKCQAVSSSGRDLLLAGGSLFHNSSFHALFSCHFEIGSELAG